MLAILGDQSGQPPLLSRNEIESIVKERPNDIIAWMKLAELAAKENDFSRAAAAYESALKVNPRLIAAVTPLAQLYAGPLANPEKAYEYAKQARALSPNDARVTSLLGSLAYAVGDYAWAYSLLQESSLRVTGDAKVLRNFAWAAYSLGKVNQARQAMEAAMKAAQPGEPTQNGRTFLELTALDDKDLLAVEPQIQRLLASDPGYIPALMARARIQAQRREMKAAAASYRQILDKFPDFAPAQRNLASIYLNDGEHKADAAQLAMRARRTLTDDPELARILTELFPNRE
jgi:cellulose synthase operon protein C